MSMRSALYSMIAMALLSGCVPSELSTTKEGSGSAKVSAKAGQETGLAGFYKVNGDCSGRNPGSLKVVTEPAHGTVRIQRFTGNPTYAAGHFLAKCNSHKVPQLGLFYRPAPGFVGSDRVVVAAKAAGSDVYGYVTFHIEVAD